MLKPHQLTDKQNSVLAFIRDFIIQHHEAPTLRELGTACGGVHTSAIICHLNALERKGFIIRKRGIRRGIMLTGSVLKTKRGRN